ncbi:MULTISPECIES: phage holin family protein [unclassified Mesorhizobium]|uniref:phage holin family protein n=1 Tax=unclassified Mesorhizobium TaxID=325217 RepID=UPI003334FC5C
MDDGSNLRPLGSVFSEGYSHLASLMRLDLRLLQAEMKVKTSTIVSSGACGIAALVLFVLAAFAMVQFLILAMIHFGVDPMVACLIVAALLGVGGVLFLYLAKRALAGWTITPVETVNQVRTDIAALKQGMRFGSTQ